jgi:hypothetical protein
MLKKIRHRSSKELVEFLTEKIENRGVPPLIFDSVMKIVFFGDHPNALPEGGVEQKFFVNKEIVSWLKNIVFEKISLEGEINQIIEKINN